jgi:hypothetical protein
MGPSSKNVAFLVASSVVLAAGIFVEAHPGEI